MCDGSLCVYKILKVRFALSGLVSDTRQIQLNKEKDRNSLFIGEQKEMNILVSCHGRMAVSFTRLTIAWKYYWNVDFHGQGLDVLLFSDVCDWHELHHGLITF